MLTALYKQHQVDQQKRRQGLEQRRHAALLAVASASDDVLDRVTRGANEVFQNQRALEAESQALQQEAVRFSRQTVQWLTLLDQFNASLKDLGDVEHWAQSLKNDMKLVTTSLEFITRPST
eukprot:EC786869.1.p1 GENE.EC786869.1~~EC786869.1.p1  ORF type:complete len:121 (+),score=46.99 EC786869.1:39-401(+)